MSQLDQLTAAVDIRRIERPRRLAPHLRLIGGGGHGSLRRVLVLGTYPPTECGLATYTANVRAALADRLERVDVVRLIEPGETHSSAPEVIATWSTADPGGSGAALDATVRADAVLLQHEFGIYPGADGEAVLEFAERCPRPLFTVLHTVLAEPSARQRAIVDRLGTLSRLVIVHSEVAQTRLLGTHDIDPSRVAIVPHGATSNLCQMDRGSSAVVDNLPVVLTWGLLGPGKGIEHGIEAVALLRAAGHDVRYIIAGDTHPKVRAREGERYRDRLIELARGRGVADLVVFDNAYRSWEALRALVRSATMVLLPYDSRDQVTSGVLVEALASGKPVVATAFPHAVELSRTGAVRVVRHQSPRACATAIADIVSDPVKRSMMTAAARHAGAEFDWPVVGARLHGLIAAEIDIASETQVET